MADLLLHSSEEGRFSRVNPNDSTYEEFTNPRLLSPLGYVGNKTVHHLQSQFYSALMLP